MHLNLFLVGTTFLARFRFKLVDFSNDFHLFSVIQHVVRVTKTIGAHIAVYIATFLVSPWQWIVVR